VLLLGESGTGKDILAQAIHNASPRRDGPYVAINCAAIPRDLIASELFGYAEGAFTGSRRGGSQGKFEMADGGTIFLDEIAETPLEIQAVLLRVIEDKSVVRIGSNQIRTVDVRIICATNKDLIEEVGRGNFRKDLYYRLNVFNIHLPPVRERKDDIPLLVDAFVKKCASALGKTITGVDEKAMEIFLRYSWPGNVRELQNVVERMVNYASSERLTSSLIPPEIAGIDRSSHRHVDLVSPEETEKNLIRHMLALKFSKVRIAEELNISRATLFRKMKKHRLNSKHSDT
jgi:transcriptional regulator with PAS, ATPase and Fis domain